MESIVYVCSDIQQLWWEGGRILHVKYVLTSNFGVFFQRINVKITCKAIIHYFRSRASAQGITTAWDYIVAFVGTKILINLETNFKLTGTFAVYAMFAYVGTIYLYFFMPETEGVPLHDVEKLYTEEFKTFANDPCINFVRRIFGFKLKRNMEKEEETDRSETRF